MAAAAAKWLRELGGRTNRSVRNLELLRRTTTPFASSNIGSSSSNFGSSSHQRDPHHPAPSSHCIASPAVADAVGGPSSFPPRFAFRGGNLLLAGGRGTEKISRVAWDPAAPGRAAADFSGIAPPSKPPSTSVGESSKIDPGGADEKKQSHGKSLGSRIKDLFTALENVPVAPLGLGLGGAIPFVGLTPGIASLLALPDALFAIHIEAQAAYGAAILAFLGGPHWGLAMAGHDWSPSSKLSKRTIQNARYIWSVIPSLVAWPALLLNPVPKFAVLITSHLVVVGVDAAFARSGLLPPWYMPMRYLLTGIATLSMTSSLIVTAAGSVITH